MRAVQGQVEFVVLFALIIVVVVLVVAAFQLGLLQPPAIVDEEQQTVAESVESLIRAGGLETLKTLGTSGGHLDPLPTDSVVTFHRQRVSYWQQAGQLISPTTEEIQQNLAAGIEQYIRDNAAGLEQALAIQNVDIGEPEVTATIFDDRIDLSVVLPTTIDGTPLPQPYTLSLQTRFGEILDFAESFTAYQQENRLFETYTLATMVGFLPPENGIPPVPLYLVLTQCGQFINLNWFDIREDVDFAIRLVLAHTYMPGKIPTNTGDLTSFPKWPIPRLDGRDYADLKVSFHLPDGLDGPGTFELTRADFQFTPEPIVLFARPIPLVGSCQSDVSDAYISYFLQYPVVTRVVDPVTGIDFRFAQSVAIKDNQAAPWTDIVGYDTDVQTEICSEMACPVELAVTDTAGAGIEAASISFLGCPIGQTGSDGRFTGFAPCGSGTLSVSKANYGPVEQFGLDVNEISAVTLQKRPSFTLRLYDVIVTNNSLAGAYTITAAGIRELNSGRGENNFAHLVLFPHSLSEQDYVEILDNRSSIPVNYINPGTYDVSGVLTDEGFIAFGGFIISGYAITADLDGGELFVYLPEDRPAFAAVPTNDEEAAQTASSNLMNTLTRVLTHPNCNLGPLSRASPEGFTSCSVSYDELG